MKVKESEKVGLKFNIQKTKIMASGPITSWQVDGETMEIVTDFIWGGSKITAGGDFSHEIKRRLCLERKAMTNLDSILKSRDISLPTNARPTKAMVFPVIMHRCVCQSLSHVWLFWDPMGCSPPVCSVHGIFPGKNTEWVAISSSRGMDVKVGL